MENTASLVWLFCQRWTPWIKSRGPIRQAQTEGHFTQLTGLHSSQIAQSCPTLCDPMVCPWDSPGKHTGVGCHAFLQESFPTQGSNPSLPHCRQILHHLSYQGSPPLFKNVRTMKCKETGGMFLNKRHWRHTTVQYKTLGWILHNFVFFFFSQFLFLFFCHTDIIGITSKFWIKFAAWIPANCIILVWHHGKVR